MRRVFRVLALAACAALGMAGWGAEVPADALPCTSFPLPAGTHSGSGYTAIEVGPDGKVYVGTAVYGGSAHFVRLDPLKKSWDDLFNTHAVTRETGVGLDSQSKFHAKPVVDADGLIWIATKQGNEEFTYRPEYGESRTGYPGGHLFAYNPQTGEIIDRGILLAQEGLMGGVIDTARRRLYYVSDPKSHFLIYDIAKNTVRDLGVAAPTPRYMAMDNNARVYFVSVSPPGYDGPCLNMYDPAADRLYTLGVQVEGADPKAYVSPYVLVASADGAKLFGAGMGGTCVMEYDTATVTLGKAGGFINGTVVCRLVDGVPPGDEHAGTRGQDGGFYFNSGDKLIRYLPQTRTVTVLGTIVAPGTWQGIHAQGAAVGADGTLYMKCIYPYQVLAFDQLTAPAGGK